MRNGVINLFSRTHFIRKTRKTVREKVLLGALDAARNGEFQQIAFQG